MHGESNLKQPTWSNKYFNCTLLTTINLESWTIFWTTFLNIFLKCRRFYKASIDHHYLASQQAWVKQQLGLNSSLIIVNDRQVRHKGVRKEQGQEVDQIRSWCKNEIDAISGHKRETKTLWILTFQEEEEEEEDLRVKNNSRFFTDCEGLKYWRFGKSLSLWSSGPITKTSQPFVLIWTRGKSLPLMALCQKYC